MKSSATRSAQQQQQLSSPSAPMVATVLSPTGAKASPRANLSPLQQVPKPPVGPPPSQSTHRIPRAPKSQALSEQQLNNNNNNNNGPPLQRRPPHQLLVQQQGIPLPLHRLPLRTGAVLHLPSSSSARGPNEHFQSQAINQQHIPSSARLVVSGTNVNKNINNNHVTGGSNASSSLVNSKLQTNPIINNNCNNGCNGFEAPSATTTTAAAAAVPLHTPRRVNVRNVSQQFPLSFFARHGVSRALRLAISKDDAQYLQQHRIPLLFDSMLSFLRFTQPLPACVPQALISMLSTIMLTKKSLSKREDTKAAATTCNTYSECKLCCCDYHVSS